MRGIDNCEKCVHRFVCAYIKYTASFCANVNQILKDDANIANKIDELLADNCNHYNDKGGDKSDE